MVFKPDRFSRYKHQNWDDTDFDLIILAADMNYRSYTPLSVTKRLIKRDLYDVLLQNDELNIEKELRGFPQILQEGPIEFAPTFKRVKPK
jgi:hypothetical protein